MLTIQNETYELLDFAALSPCLRVGAATERTLVTFGYWIMDALGRLQALLGCVSHCKDGQEIRATPSDEKASLNMSGLSRFDFVMSANGIVRARGPERDASRQRHGVS